MAEFYLGEPMADRHPLENQRKVAAEGGVYHAAFEAWTKQYVSMTCSLPEGDKEALLAAALYLKGQLYLSYGKSNIREAKIFSEENPDDAILIE